jgi:LmeA-like phospholipid-binding
LRKLLFSLVFLLALLLAVEIGVTILSERGVEKVMSSQYGLPSNLKVSINSFPLTMSLVRNHLGEIRLSWEDELTFMSSNGTETRAPYYGKVVVYDVELNMTSLLKGHLEIRKISHLETSISFDESSINSAFGRENGSFKVEDGHIYEDYYGLKIQYKVKVVDGNTISIEPFLGSTNDEDSPENPQSVVHYASFTIRIPGLPLNAKLESVSSEGNRVILSISIPMWEGYL